MTSIDKSGFTLASLGPQVQSNRRSSPSFTLSKVGRHQRECTYISEEHTRIQMVGRESPKGGPIYEVPSSLDKKSCGFGAGKRPDLYLKRGDPDDVPTNDALGVHPDSQPFKYRRDPAIVIGTEPRGKLKDAALLHNHSAAFFGRESPGPASVGETYGPNISPTRPRIAMAVPFGGKLKMNWMRTGDNPPDVGPGRHERKDVAIGPQHLSKRRNQSVHLFPNAAKFPKKRIEDSISVLDAAFSAMGKQTLDKHRSEPSIGFNKDTRDARSRTKLCMTKADEGPRANLPRAVFSMPRLPAG